MNSILIYALEVNLTILLFALVYHFIFRNEKYYTTNRIVILGMIGTAFAIPILDFSQSEMPLQIAELETIVISAKQSTLATPVGFNMPSILSSVYIIGAITALLLLLVQLISLQRTIRNGRTQRAGIAKLIFNSKMKSPGSFFSNIFWRADLSHKHDKWIMDHELVHVSEYHSLDIILIRLAQIACWFNPAIYYFKIELEATHEFRADQVVAKTHNDISTYSKVLLSQALGVDTGFLTHHFSKPNLLKRRIIMLNKTKNKKATVLKYALLIPTVAMAMSINACTKDGGQKSTEANEDQIVQAQTSDDKIYEVVEKMPEYPGGKEAMMKYLGNNIKYPENCKKDGPEGMVVLSFVIDKDGAVTDVQSVSSPDERLTMAAIDVIAQMEPWIPGQQDGKNVKVKFKLPIRYKLEEDESIPVVREIK